MRKIRCSDGTEPLLPRGVPDLKLDHSALKGDRLHFLCGRSKRMKGRGEKGDGER